MGYSGGEIANIASEAAKDFASTLKGIPNSELKNHPFFVACQFHPEFLSRPLKPHPLFLGFIEAAIKLEENHE